MARRSIGLRGFLLRVIAAIVIVLATYNPTGNSFFHWVKEGFTENLEIKVLVAVVLVIAYVVLLRSTLASIGPFGAILVAALVGSVTWVLVSSGIVSLENQAAVEWLALIGIGLILGVGLSWSLVRRRLSGQLDVDEVEE